MHQSSRFLRVVLGCGLLATQAVATAKMTFVPPQHMVDNWKSYAGMQAVGRIKKIEPYADYESLSPCTIDKQWCDMVRPKLQVATVQFAKAGDTEVSWIVTIPTEQHMKIGEYMLFTFPSSAKEIGDGVMDDIGKMRTVQCNWGKVDNGHGFEGVICEKWNYSQLNAKGALDKAAGPAVADSSASPALGGAASAPAAK